MVEPIDVALIKKHLVGKLGLSASVAALMRIAGGLVLRKRQTELYLLYAP